MNPHDPRCPACGAPASGAPDACAQCGVGLGGYWRLAFRPWRFYNRALALYGAGRFVAAACEAAGAAALAPDRYEFRLLAAQLLARAGDTDAAISHARAALALAGDDRQAELLLEALFEDKYRPQCRPPSGPCVGVPSDAG